MALINNMKYYNNNLINHWDKLASSFGTHNPQNIHYLPGKENYDVIIPFFDQVINNNDTLTDYNKIKVCDFGCGTGLLVKKMNDMGFKAYGCDISKEMVKRANEVNSLNEAIIEEGSYDILEKYAPYKIITAIMVFQFIPNLYDVLLKIYDCLDKNGILIIAVHNTEYVIECMTYDVKFRGINNYSFPLTGEISIDNNWIQTYLRTPEWYDNTMHLLGFTKEKSTYMSRKPPLEISNIDKQWKSAKYYIACYKK